MALAFASRYRALTVLVAVTVATLLVHAGSVVLGATFALALPTSVIQVVAGIAFFGFAAWTLRGDDLGEADQDRATRSVGVALMTIGTAFVLAELGDKTMLATITLATTEEPWGTWLGSTAGMGRPTPPPSASARSWAPDCRAGHQALRGCDVRGLRRAPRGRGLGMAVTRRRPGQSN